MSAEKAAVLNGLSTWCPRVGSIASPETLLSWCVGSIASPETLVGSLSARGAAQSAAVASESESVSASSGCLVMCVSAATGASAGGSSTVSE